MKNPIGEEGWEALAEGLHLHPRLRLFSTTKYVLEEGKEDDMRKIWDALPSAVPATWRVHDSEEGLTEHIGKQDGEAGWEGLKQVKNMSKEDWAATMRTDETDTSGEESGEEEESGGAGEGDEEVGEMEEEEEEELEELGSPDS